MVFLVQNNLHSLLFRRDALRVLKEAAPGRPPPFTGPVFLFWAHATHQSLETLASPGGVGLRAWGFPYKMGLTRRNTLLPHFPSCPFVCFRAIAVRCLPSIFRPRSS